MRDAIVGVSDHGGWAVLVTVAADGAVLDRRRVELVEEGLPKIPHHVEAQGLTVEKGVALVERVRESAERMAAVVWDELALAVPGRIGGVALRQCPELPPTVAERLADYRARNVADWVMYRRALAGAAAERGWPVHWYDSRQVIPAAREALGEQALELRRRLGAPWGQDHRLAMAAGIVALRPAFQKPAGLE